MTLSRPCAVVMKSSVRSPDPLDRTAELLRRPKQHHPFGIQRILHAEAAADIGAGDVHLFARHAEHVIRQLVLQCMHAGTGEQQMVAAVVVLADGATGFQSGDDDAVVHQLQFDDVGRCADGCLHSRRVSLLEPIRHVAGRLLPDLYGVGAHRGGAIDDGWQGLPIHHDLFRRITRGVTRLGDDERHRIADVTRSFGREGMARRRDHAGDWHHAWQRTKVNKSAESSA